MNYTEQLAKAKEMNINICELTIAWEVESAYAPTDHVLNVYVNSHTITGSQVNMRHSRK